MVLPRVPVGLFSCCLRRKFSGEATIVTSGKKTLWSWHLRTSLPWVQILNSVADWRSNLVLDRFPSDNDLTRTVIGRITGMLPRSPKNQFFGSKKLQTKKKANAGSKFEWAFRGAVQFTWDSSFSNILELKPVQEEALLHYVLHQAKRCVCGASNRIREVFDLSNRSESMCIFARSRVQLS